MKKHVTLWIAALVLSATCLYAFAEQSPFPPWISKYFESNPPRAGKHADRKATAIYDVAVHGGASTSRGLGVYLPTSTVITRSYFQILTPFTAPAGALLALSCEDAGNIKAASVVSSQSANTFVDGESTGAIAGFKSDISAPCQISALPSVQAFSTGKLKLWLEYNVTE